MSESKSGKGRALPPLQPGTTSQRLTRTLPPLAKIENNTQSTSDNQTPPRRTPRKRRQKPAGDIPGKSNPKQDEEDGRSQSNTGESNRGDAPRTDGVRRPRTRKPPSLAQDAGETNPGLIATIENDEDIIKVERADEPVALTTLPGLAGGMGGSAPNDRVYVQTTNGFIARNREWFDRRNDVSDTHVPYGEERDKPFDIARQNEKGFMYITLVLHGALAGIAIWHTVFCFSLYQPNRAQNFLVQYQTLAVPAQTMYYIILSFLVVSALDRYDYGNKEKHFFHSLSKFDLAAVSIVVYYLTFMFSIGLSGLDAWIGSGVGITETTTTTTTVPPGTTTTALPTELTGSSLDAADTVNTWLIISVFRAVFASLGWLIIAFDPLRNDMSFEK